MTSMHPEDDCPLDQDNYLLANGVTPQDPLRTLETIREDEAGYLMANGLGVVKEEETET